MAVEFKLPELGENINEAQVVTINVAEGDAIDAEQEVIEVETDKAVMPVPAPAAGTVGSIKIKEGDTLKVGDVIFTIEEGGGGGEKKKQKEEAPAAKKQAEAEPEPREDPQAEAEPEPEKAKSQAPADASAQVPQKTDAPPPAPPRGDDDRLPAFAAPSVRRFARELGVDIARVEGTGPGGRISIDDVKNHSRSHGTGGAASVGAPSLAGALPDLAQYGPVEREAMSMIAKKTAAHMAMCWATIPHVTLHQEVDATDMEAFRGSHKRVVEKAGGKLTPTAILVKIVAEALSRHPMLNCAYDAQKQELVYRNYVHVGVAVDTPRGLVVPVLRDADTKSLADISVELGEFAEKARGGKLALEDMQGGCFTITNLGGIGVEQFSPIVNWPEVGILGVGTASQRLVERNDDVESRLMMPLSLSFDHRVVNGADGARFLQWIRNAIEQPLAAFLT